MSDPRAQWFAVGRRGLLAYETKGVGNGWRLPTPTDLAALGIATSGAEPVHRAAEREAFAVRVDDAIALPSGWSLLGLRGLVTAFDDATFALAGRASHVLDWAETSRYCGRCGAKTVRVPGERCMRCPSCEASTYPRISPAVIVLVRRGEEALLARNARFPVPFFSTLAGFAEVGETLEETVAREIREEVGVEVGRLRYFGSQPWPFPNSLMIAFLAEWERGDITVDGEEIAEARWFRANELPMIPPPISIARRMIDAWVADVTHTNG